MKNADALHPLTRASPPPLFTSQTSVILLHTTPHTDTPAPTPTPCVCVCVRVHVEKRKLVEAKRKVCAHAEMDKCSRRVVPGGDGLRDVRAEMRDVSATVRAPDHQGLHAQSIPEWVHREASSPRRSSARCLNDHCVHSYSTASIIRRCTLTYSVSRPSTGRRAGQAAFNAVATPLFFRIRLPLPSSLRAFVVSHAEGQTWACRTHTHTKHTPTQERAREVASVEVCASRSSPGPPPPLPPCLALSLDPLPEDALHLSIDDWRAKGAWRRRRGGRCA